MVTRWLEHPLTRGLPLDSPETTRLRRTVIATKPFLRQLYEEVRGYAAPVRLEGWGQGSRARIRSRLSSTAHPGRDLF